MRSLAVPVRPWRGFRDTDSYGSGVFLASRDNGARKHLGRDLVTVPGDFIFAPFPCVVARIGTPYPDGKLHLMELHGGADFFGWRSRIMYVKPTVAVGMKLDAGEMLGEAEDLTAYYRETHPGHTGDITCHVHVEIDMPVDIGELLPHDLRPGVTA
jgi:hypothetical protein